MYKSFDQCIDAMSAFPLDPIQRDHILETIYPLETTTLLETTTWTGNTPNLEFHLHKSWYAPSSHPDAAHCINHQA